MEAAQTLDGDELASTQQHQGRRDWIAADGLGLCVDERELWPAVRTSVGFGMEAPACRISVLGQAQRALRKRCHTGLGAIVGQGARQRESWAALCAVDEGVAVAPVGRVEQFGQAVVAGGGVGWDRRRHCPRAAGQDSKVFVAVDWRARGGFEPFYPCQRGGI